MTFELRRAFIYILRFGRNFITRQLYRHFVTRYHYYWLKSFSISFIGIINKYGEAGIIY